MQVRKWLIVATICIGIAIVVWVAWLIIVNTGVDLVLPGLHRI